MRLAVEQLDAHVDDGVALRPAGGERVARALLDGRDVGARHRAAHDGVDELEPAAGGSGLTRSCTTANWPWPPDCFLSLPSARAGFAIVSRYATGAGPVVTCTPSTRASRSTATATWVSPSPRRIVSPPARSIRSVWSSASSRASAVESFASSDCVAGVRLTA